MAEHSNSRSIVKPVKEVATLEYRLFGKDLEGLFQNKEQLRWLIYLMQEYEDRLKPAQSLCMWVIGYDRICFLVDFDVIRNFLEMKSLNNVETCVVDFLFLNSKVGFAIPVGAFEELLDYLTSLTKTSYQLERLGEDHNREEVIRLISRAIGITHSDELTTSELLEEIGNCLEESILQLNRLLELLTNPRFEGVKTQYDKECFNAWLKVISVCERGRWFKHKPRDLVDRRDAANLAIASMSLPYATRLPRDTSKSGEVCYILVSQTAAVFDMIQESKKEEEFEAITSFFGIEMFVLQRMHPAVHPYDAMVVELLGGVDHPADTLKRLKARISNVRQTGDNLLDEYLRQAGGEPKKIYMEAFGPYIEEQRRQITEDLKRISEEGLDSRSRMCLIEERRATVESEEQARRRQSGVPVQHEDEIRAKTLQFMRLLGEIAEALEVTSGAGYRAEISMPEGPAPFAKVRVQPDTDTFCAAESLITGEFYAFVRKNGSLGPWQYFSMRWPITCLEEQLIAGLCKVWCLTATPHRSTRNAQLISVDANHEYWKQGLIISTPVRDLGMSLQEASDDGKWEWLKLSKLGPLVKERLGTIKAPEGRELTPAILQLRLNTSLGDIIYDVTSVADTGKRYLTILSHFNLGRQIAQLYWNTGPLFCIPSKLADVLNECLKDFCPIGSV